MFETLISKIVDILEANTLVQEVFNYEVEKFEGDPAVTVTPSANESDYNTTEENVRIYAFTVRVFVDRTVRAKVEADRIMRSIVSSILDDFDKDYTLSGMTSPTGYTFINVFAVPSTWGYINRESEYRVAEINLRCRVSVDIGAIS